MKTTKQQSSRKAVSSLREIPRFASESEEGEWWAEHDLAEELYDELEPPAAELRKLLSGRADNGVVKIAIEGPPPVYGAALSLMSPKHPHASRVATLRATAERVMTGRPPFRRPVIMAVSQIYADSAKADAANIIGALSNALEGIVYANDSLIREAYFRSKRGERSSYVVLVRTLR